MSVAQLPKEEYLPPVSTGEEGVRQYLHDIGQYPRLTPQQELELANIEAQTAKVQAQKEKEVAQIAAEKAIIDAEAEAEAMRIAAAAEADANREVAASLTAELIEKIKYERWNGKLPTVSGSASIVDIGGLE